MSIINNIFSQFFTNNYQKVLVKPEVLFDQHINPKGYSEDSFMYSGASQTAQTASKVDKSFIGTIGNMFSKLENKTISFVDEIASIPNKSKIVDTKNKDVHGRNIKLSAEASHYFDKLINIAKTKGISLQVRSSYRSVSEQRVLWNKALRTYGSSDEARKWVAPPGKSRHNSGNAIDLDMYKNGRQVSQSEFDKLAKLAGFYRPMSWETWHIEPMSTKASRSQNA